MEKLYLETILRNSSLETATERFQTIVVPKTHEIILVKFISKVNSFTCIFEHKFRRCRKSCTSKNGQSKGTFFGADKVAACQLLHGVYKMSALG